MGCKCKEVLEAERKFGMGVRIHCLEMRAKALEERLSELEQPEKKEIRKGFEGWVRRLEKDYTLSIFIDWLEEQKKIPIVLEVCPPRGLSIRDWEYIIGCLIERAKKG